MPVDEGLGGNAGTAAAVVIAGLLLLGIIVLGAMILSKKISTSEKAAGPSAGRSGLSDRRGSEMKPIKWDHAGKSGADSQMPVAPLVLLGLGLILTSLLFYGSMEAQEARGDEPLVGSGMVVLFILAAVLASVGLDLARCRQWSIAWLPSLAGWAVFLVLVWFLFRTFLEAV